MSTPYNRKQPCRNFAAGNCTKRNCQFAHISAGGGGGGGGNKGSLSIGGGQVLATLIKLLFEKTQDAIYVAEQRRLNISNFKACPDVQSMVSSIDFNTAGFCDALCTAIADKMGPTGMTILDVGNNQIRSLTHLVNALKKHGLHTNLSALSVEGNAIGTTDFTQQLSSFPNLTQLVMLGNPVVANADYRQTVRKRLPHLIGLDKQPIQRPPLALPWPLRQSGAAMTEATNMALGFVTEYFNMINTQGLDSVVDRYHQQAVFSLSYVLEQSTVKWEGGDNHNNSTNNNNNNAASSSTGAGILTSPNRRPPLPSKEILRDVTALRVSQSEGNHNVMKGVKNTNIARGRAEVVSKLSHLIYQRSFTVEHSFHTTVNAMMMPDGALPFAMIVVTMHGCMCWRHRTATDLQFTRVFDRTMTLVPHPNNSAQLVIANDMIELRPNAEDPLFFADNGIRVEMVSRKYGLPPPIAYACMSMGPQSDQGWFGLMAELQTNVPVSLLEMVATQIGADDIPKVINVARIMAHKQMNDVGAAVQILAAAGGDINNVQ